MSWNLIGSTPAAACVDGAQLLDWLEKREQNQD